MSAVGSSNPEYVVARVRARRGSLYGDEEYRKLTRMGPAEIARFMESRATARRSTPSGVVTAAWT